jgi:HK97 family phage portal protein
MTRIPRIRSGPSRDMGLLDRLRNTFTPSAPDQERRGYGEDVAAARFAQIYHNLDGLGGLSAAAALEVSVVGACIQKIAQTIASLDVDVYRVDGEKQERIDHPLRSLIRRSPVEGFTAFDFWERVVSDAYLFGRSFVLIHRDTSGRVEALEPLDPMKLKDAELADGRAAYMDTDTNEVHLEEELLIVKAFRGRSPIETNRRSIGLMRAAEGYASGFFSSGGNVSGVLSTDHTLSDEQFERLRSSWHSRNHGPSGAHRTAILENGVKFERVGANPEAAQLNAARKFQAEQIALAMGVPPALLGLDTGVTYSNTEEQGKHFATFTIGPLVRRIEQEVHLKLIAESESDRTEIRFQMSTLLRPNVKDAGEYYSRLLAAGVVSINEARERLENLNPIDGGDTHFVAVNLAPLDSFESGDEDPEQDTAVEPDPPADGDELPTEG